MPPALLPPRARAAITARVGGLPRTFWLLWTGTLVNRLGTFVEPFLVLYLTIERGLSFGSAGLVLGLYGVGSIGGPILGGTLADRLGRRATMVGALLVSAGLLVGLGTASELWLLASFAFLLGVAGDAYRPAAQAAVADVVAFSDRRRAAGLLYWAVNLGFSAAAVGGGLLAESGYLWLFVVDAATCVAYAAVVGVFVGETLPQAAPGDAEEAAAPRGSWSALARDRVVVLQLLLMLIGAAAQTQLYAVLPLSMEAEGFSPATFGAVLAVNGVVIVLVQPILQTPMLRVRPGHLLAISWGLFAAGMVVMALAGPLWLFVAGVLVMTLAEILSASIGPGLIQELASPRARGRYAGAYGLTYSVSFAVVPVVATQLLGEDGGDPTPWLLGAGLAAAAVVGQLALGPALERRRQEAERAEAARQAPAGVVAPPPAPRPERV